RRTTVAEESGQVAVEIGQGRVEIHPALTDYSVLPLTARELLAQCREGLVGGEGAAGGVLGDLTARGVGGLTSGDLTGLGVGLAGLLDLLAVRVEPLAGLGVLP